MVWYRHISQQQKGCSFESQETIIPTLCSICKKENGKIIVDISLMIAKSKFPQENLVRDNEDIKISQKTRKQSALCEGQDLQDKQLELYKRLKPQQINILLNEEFCQILYKVINEHKFTNILAGFVNNSLVLFYYPLKLRVVYFIDQIMNFRQRQVLIFEQNIFIISENTQDNYFLFKIDIEDLKETRLKLQLIQQFRKLANKEAPQLAIIKNQLHLLYQDDQMDIDLIWSNGKFSKYSIQLNYFYILSNENKFQNDDLISYAIDKNKLNVHNEHGEKSFYRNREIGTVLICKGVGSVIQDQIMPQKENTITVLEIQNDRGFLRSSEQEYMISTEQDFAQMRTTISTAFGNSEIVTLSYGQYQYPAVMVLVPPKKSIFIEIL